MSRTAHNNEIQWHIDNPSSGGCVGPNCTSKMGSAHSPECIAKHESQYVQAAPQLGAMLYDICYVWSPTVSMKKLAEHLLDQGWVKKS